MFVPDQCPVVNQTSIPFLIQFPEPQIYWRKRLLLLKWSCSFITKSVSEYNSMLTLTEFFSASFIRRTCSFSMPWHLLRCFPNVFFEAWRSYNDGNVSVIYIYGFLYVIINISTYFCMFQSEIKYMKIYYD